MSSVTERTELVQQLKTAYTELQKMVKRIDKLEYDLYMLDETSVDLEPPDCEQCGRPRCICGEEDEDEEDFFG